MKDAGATRVQRGRPDGRPVVLVLDGNQRSALAVTRSLGVRGLAVYVADCDRINLASCSRWSTASLACPSALDAPSEFSVWVSKTVREIGAEAVFALTEVSSRTLLASDDSLLKTLLPFPDAATVDQLADKARLIELAGSLGIPCPVSSLWNRGRDIRSDALPASSFVVKPTRSHVRIGHRWMPTTVQVLSDKAALESRLTANPVLADHPVLVQEYIPGSGAGVFALYDHGTPLAFFAHRRLREKPPGGGVSVLSESAPLDPQLLQSARLLLDRSRWHGVAMVEFRVTPDGRPFLMEVNARFWGSLQLAIDSGSDFPWLLWQVVKGTHPEAVPTYRIGRRLRWLLGDVDHLYLTLRGDGEDPSIGKLQRLASFLTPHPFTTRHEVNRWADPKPAWFELKKYVRELSK